MKLFHAFRRPRHRKDQDGKLIRDPVTDADREKSFEILQLILKYGLLCTPENFGLYPNYNTQNKQKKEFLKNKKPHEEFVQSRACFTLVDTRELSQAYKLGKGDNNEYVTHTELFGEFAIGLDPVEARELGILPTVYYYRHDLGHSLNPMAGLGWQIIERLDEARTVFSVLSYLESWDNKGPDDLSYPSQERLKEMGILIRYQPEIEEELKKLKTREAKLIMRLFDTDRVPAWNLVDFIQILLSLYQCTDSTIQDAPLAFFQQREWRLVHHMNRHLRWFGLGNHKPYRNPRALEFAGEIKALKEFLEGVGGKRSKAATEWFLSYCWVLAGTLNLNFRDYVREIVVPATYVERAQDLVNSLEFASKRPQVIPLAPKWRIETENGAPRIITAPNL